MKIGRRQFLKGAMLSGGLAVILPGNLLEMFPDLPKPGLKSLKPDSELESSTVAMGLGYIRTGDSLKHITHTDAVLSGKNRLASVEFRGQATFCTSPNEHDAFRYVFELECAFRERFSFVGKRGRVEARFAYPTGGNYMDIILPKAEIIKTKVADGVNTVLFRAIPVTNKAWSNNPYGIIKWVL